jgi:hypothetical protein
MSLNLKDRLVIPLLAKFPELLISSLRYANGPKKRNFMNLEANYVPEDIVSFEDLYFLFNCNNSNRGIVALDFDEAAYLFKIVKKLQNANILEIGRFLGGSTVLFSVAAKQGNSKVHSIDLKFKTPQFAKDDVLSSFLNSKKLDNVSLYVGNSREYEFKINFDLVFIDGDHSYEGVLGDYKNIIKNVSSNGHIVFHDSISGREFCSEHLPVAKFVNELIASEELIFIKNIGSLAHFKKK